MTAPIVWREPVQDAWIDYNRHLSEPYYVLVFGHGTDAVLDRIGIDAAYRAQTVRSVFTVEAHVRYLDQVAAGADLEVRSSIIGCTDKLLWIWHELWAEDRLRATEEVLGLHVDAAAGRATPFGSDVAERIATLQVAPGPDVSRRIAVGSP